MHTPKHNLKTSREKPDLPRCYVTKNCIVKFNIIVTSYTKGNPYLNVKISFTRIKKKKVAFDHFTRCIGY